MDEAPILEQDAPEDVAELIEIVSDDIVAGEEEEIIEEVTKRQSQKEFFIFLIWMR